MFLCSRRYKSRFAQRVKQLTVDSQYVNGHDGDVRSGVSCEYGLVCWSKICSLRTLQLQHKNATKSTTPKKRHPPKDYHHKKHLRPKQHHHNNPTTTKTPPQQHDGKNINTKSTTTQNTTSQSTTTQNTTRKTPR